MTTFERSKWRLLVRWKGTTDQEKRTGATASAYGRIANCFQWALFSATAINIIPTCALLLDEIKTCNFSVLLKMADGGLRPEKADNGRRRYQLDGHCCNEPGSVLLESVQAHRSVRAFSVCALGEKAIELLQFSGYCWLFGAETVDGAVRWCFWWSFSHWQNTVYSGSTSLFSCGLLALTLAWPTLSLVATCALCLIVFVYCFGASRSLLFGHSVVATKAKEKERRRSQPIWIYANYILIHFLPRRRPTWNTI